MELWAYLCPELCQKSAHLPGSPHRKTMTCGPRAGGVSPALSPAALSVSGRQSLAQGAAVRRLYGTDPTAVGSGEAVVKRDFSGVTSRNSDSLHS